MLVREHLDPLEARRVVQIFATDLDAELLSEARAGRYPLSIAEQVGPERLARFFVRQERDYLAGKDLREMCIFSEHSLVRDPPFSQMDLISCRNVLVYLNADLQKKLIPLFHYALRPGGFLFLGTSEGIAGNPDLFETIDKRDRIFRRRETVSRPVVDFPLAPRNMVRQAEGASIIRAREIPAPTLQQKASAAFERMVLDEYTAPSAVVNARGELVFVAGRLGLTALLYPAWVASRYINGESIIALIVLLVFVPVLHRSVNIIGFKMGKKKEPW
jgi:two-component system CheB/CheR fusion protein